jgi:ribonuclease E
MRFGFRKPKEPKPEPKTAAPQKSDGQRVGAVPVKTGNGKTKARRKPLGLASKMLINAVEAEEFRIAVIKDGRLDGFYIETAATEQKTGNIYKGVVERVEPSLQACFVNFGGDKNGFLSVTDIHPEYYAVEPEPKKETSLPRIEKILKKGQELLVQVTKEMQGRKGAQLTTYLSLASRHLVLMPGSKGGISKKIEEEEERQRLKSIMTQFKLPEGVGYIVRTAALKQSKRDLSRDLNRLLRMWKNIKKNVQEASVLTLVHKEQDVCLRTLRDYFTSEIAEVLVDDKETLGKVKDYMKIISPRHQGRVKLFKEKRPIFAQYEIEKQIETIYRNRVPLKSGGSIVIDPTEALVAIDVNSGRWRTGKQVENTAFKTNIEAAEEIARQLRLRDMGGLVVIDFIDMREKKHIREVEKVVRDKAKEDRAKISVSHISKFGLLELSRQRLRPSIESVSYQTCENCNGRGIVPSVETAAISFLRRIRMGLSKKGILQVKGVLSEDVVVYLQNRKRKELSHMEARYGLEITLLGDPSLSPDGGILEFIKEERS